MFERNGKNIPKYFLPGGKDFATGNVGIEGNVKKDKFLIALFLYGFVLLLIAGGSSFWFPKETFAVLKTEKDTKQAEIPTPTGNDLPQPTQGVAREDSNSGPTPTPEKEYNKTTDDTEPPKNPWELLTAETTPEWRKTIGERCIVFPKRMSGFDGTDVVLLLSDMPVERSISLEFSSCAAPWEYSFAELERINENEFFVGSPILPEETIAAADETSKAAVDETNTKDPLRQMKQLCVKQEDGSYTLSLELILNRTYVYNVYETETHYFISLRDAKSVYDRIVVLDAGHGGWDTGTLSYDRQFAEKDINLQVLLYLDELLRTENITVYTTRTTDRYVGHTDRITLANSLEADLFLSIHCNNAYQNPDANGTEVLYTQYQNDREGLNSKALSKLCLEELVSALKLNNRGLFARGDDLTVLSKAKVPATLVELAFMSNKGDMEVLQLEETQRAAAEALYRAILRALQ